MEAHIIDYYLRIRCLGICEGIRIGYSTHIYYFLFTDNNKCDFCHHRFNRFSWISCSIESIFMNSMMTFHIFCVHHKNVLLLFSFATFLPIYKRYFYGGIKMYCTQSISSSFLRYCQIESTLCEENKRIANKWNLSLLHSQRVSIINNIHFSRCFVIGLLSIAICFG